MTIKKKELKSFMKMDKSMHMNELYCVVLAV